MFVLLRYNRGKAMDKGLWSKKQRSGRTFMQSLWFYTVEFDRKFEILHLTSFADCISLGNLPSRSRSRPFPSPFHHRRLSG